MNDHPWPDLPVERELFREPRREFGILPFWFLNGALEPEEMRYQLRELREKGMPGVILHGRYGLEMPYLSAAYLDRIRFAVQEAERLGLKTWIYDEMNWPSGTADQRVLRARPDLAQRYLECIHFTVRGPWFTYLTGADSRYLDFERSTPVAAFAIGADGQVIDLTPNLSFVNVIPWEAPAGNWRLVYIVEKRAGYYIDALNPEATAEFLRQGYEPYLPAIADGLGSQTLGFYTDEPAMHYFLSAGEVPIVPWTWEMFQRFQQRNGYNLRPRLPDLFFDLSPDSARVRYDYYTTLTEFYSQAFYRQIHEWCRQRNLLFTGHLLYEESVRRMIRVEGNLFEHYAHMDVIGVDHLYPIVGSRDRPDEHVAIKVASSAAHQLGSPRLLCESFGGIFMDATPQRMKWIADWEYLLGVNLLNPHGFHYTLEGPRKRDWPPSQFYQYPWWHYYGRFSEYISRLGQLLSGGRHVARTAVLWPIHSMFGLYLPQERTPLGERLENDFNTLTDLLLRVHYDFDYLDEDLLATAEIAGGVIRLRDEAYELLVLPPMAYLKLETVDRLEQFVAQGGRLLGMVFLPDRAFGPDGLVDISRRIETLFGVHPSQSQKEYAGFTGLERLERQHAGGGKTAFLRTYALTRQLPLACQEELGLPGRPESPCFAIETDSDGASRYYFALPGKPRREITAAVVAERQQVAEALAQALQALLPPDVTLDNPEIFCLHREKGGRDVYFFVNPTFAPQAAEASIAGQVQPLLWDAASGEEKPLAPWQSGEGRTRFRLELPPVGSAFVVTAPQPAQRIVETNLVLDEIAEGRVRGYCRERQGYLVVERDGRRERFAASAGDLPKPLSLEGEWQFEPEGLNALAIGRWLSKAEEAGVDRAAYADPAADESGWLPMLPGAWSYQLPAEPAAPYPIPVWYRIRFQAAYLPARLDLIVDGFAGSQWRLFVNGQPVTAAPVRSPFDSQMQALEITPQARLGENLLALRLVVTGATDGLLDLVRLAGEFSLEAGEGGYCLAPPRRRLRPAPWTDQGYPHFSGRAVYRRRFDLPAEFAGKRLFLEIDSGDDVIEVLANGRAAGVCLWPPYRVEVSDFLHPGENSLELRVANTLANLLEGVERPSGLASAPRLVACHPCAFDLRSDAPPTTPRRRSKRPR